MSLDLFVVIVIGTDGVVFETAALAAVVGHEFLSLNLIRTDGGVFDTGALAAVAVAVRFDFDSSFHRTIHTLSVRGFGTSERERFFLASFFLFW